MALSNAEKQQRFCNSKIEAGESRISCWLSEDDTERLKKLMDILGHEGNSKKKKGYSKVISQALKELEISLTPAPHKNLMRYGLLIMPDKDQ